MAVPGRRKQALQRVGWPGGSWWSPRPFGFSTPLRMGEVKILTRSCCRSDDSRSTHGRGLKIVMAEAG